MELYDSRPEEEKQSDTKVRSKRVLLILPVVAILGGLAFAGYVFFEPVRAAVQAVMSPSPANAPNDPGQSATEKVKPPEKSFLGLLKKPSAPIVFQGSVTGKDGEIMALISGETVTAGAELHEVKVLEVTRQSVLLEFAGKGYRLLPGEQLKP